MYILSTGKIASNNKQRLADIINTNMLLDVLDVPLAGYGIVQNFCKDNLSDTITILELMINDFLGKVNESNLVLNKIEYKNNQFVIIFNYQGSELIFNIDSIKVYE